MTQKRTMKFIGFALIAGLCLAGINAESFDLPTEIELQAFVEQYSNDQSWPVIVLRSIKGIKCAFTNVSNLKTAAVQFIRDIESCGGQVTQDIRDIITACEKVIATCDQILHFKTTICNNVKPNDNHQCLKRVGAKFATLKIQVTNAVQSIKSVTSIPSDAWSCMGSALHALEYAFTSYPAVIVECSQIRG